MEGNLGYLREKYAIGFITFEELEQGLHSVLSGGAINVPRADGVPPLPVLAPSPFLRARR